MAKPKALRDLALHHFNDGKSVKEINEALGRKVTERSIRNWIKSFQKYGRLAPNKSTGRPRTALKAENISKIKHLFNRRYTCRKISRKLQISKGFLFNILFLIFFIY
jgi:transposase